MESKWINLEKDLEKIQKKVQKSFRNRLRKKFSNQCPKWVRNTRLVYLHSGKIIVFDRYWVAGLDWRVATSTENVPLASPLTTLIHFPFLLSFLWNIRSNGLCNYLNFLAVQRLGITATNAFYRNLQVGQWTKFSKRFYVISPALGHYSRSGAASKQGKVK